MRILPAPIDADATSDFENCQDSIDLCVQRTQTFTHGDWIFKICFWGNSLMMELENLTKSYDGTRVLADVSLVVGNDEYLTVLGPSGSGKSTLLRLIAGLEWPDAGIIRLNGEDISSRPAHLRDLGFVQQKYALFPHLTVYENVAFGLRNRQVDPVTSENEIAQRVGRILQLTGLAELGGRMTGQISGGQKQRVSLARTLVAEPKICLLDEPLGALDANLRERMVVELRHIREALGVTFVHATGNETEALSMGDRLIVLDDGRLLQTGEPDEVYSLPATVRVARSVNAYNILSGEVLDGAFQYAGTALPLSPGCEAARHYAVPFGVIEIAKNIALSPTLGSIEGKFIASEFIGSRMVYFFRGPNGGLLEIEHHLSKSDPVDFQKDEQRLLTWSVGDVLTYDNEGYLITPAKAGMKA